MPRKNVQQKMAASASRAAGAASRMAVEEEALRKALERGWGGRIISMEEMCVWIPLFGYRVASYCYVRFRFGAVLSHCTAPYRTIIKK